MNNISWKDKMKEFQTIDVRHLHGNFFEGLKKKAESLAVGQGLHIVQGFEPYPLYAVMEGLGYEHFTEKAGETEFHAYFYRTENKSGEDDAPFKPLALLNYKRYSQSTIPAYSPSFLNAICHSFTILSNSLFRYALGM